MGKKTEKGGKDGGALKTSKGKQRKQPRSMEEVMSMAKQWSADVKAEEKRKERAKGQKLLLEKGAVKYDPRSPHGDTTKGVKPWDAAKLNEFFGKSGFDQKFAKETMGERRDRAVGVLVEMGIIDGDRKSKKLGKPEVLSSDDEEDEDEGEDTESVGEEEEEEEGLEEDTESEGSRSEEEDEEEETKDGALLHDCSVNKQESDDSSDDDLFSKGVVERKEENTVEFVKASRPALRATTTQQRQSPANLGFKTPGQSVAYSDVFGKGSGGDEKSVKKLQFHDEVRETVWKAGNQMGIMMEVAHNKSLIETYLPDTFVRGGRVTDEDVKMQANVRDTILLPVLACEYYVDAKRVDKEKRMVMVQPVTCNDPSGLPVWLDRGRIDAVCEPLGEGAALFIVQNGLKPGSVSRIVPGSLDLKGEMRLEKAMRWVDKSNYPAKYASPFKNGDEWWTFATKMEPVVGRMALRNYISEVVTQLAVRVRMVMNEKGDYGKMLVMELGQSDQVVEEMVAGQGIGNMIYCGVDTVPRVVKTATGANLVAMMAVDASTSLDMPRPGVVFGFLSRVVEPTLMGQLMASNKNVYATALTVGEGTLKAMKGFEEILRVKIPEYAFLPETQIEYLRMEKLEMVVYVRDEVMARAKLLPKPVVMGAGSAVPSPMKEKIAVPRTKGIESDGQGTSGVNKKNMKRGNNGGKRKATSPGEGEKTGGRKLKVVKKGDKTKEGFVPEGWSLGELEDLVARKRAEEEKKGKCVGSSRRSLDKGLNCQSTSKKVRQAE